MGNRIFLYTVDRMPVDGHVPAICDAVAEASNFLPPLWTVLFSAAIHGPSQDAQQVFLPSVCGGIYAGRALAEERMSRLLGFIATHPLLSCPEDFAEQVEWLKAALASADGTAYYGELNEYFWLGDEPSPEAMMDRFVRECAARWEQAEAAMDRGDHALVEKLFAFTPHDAAAELGFMCWTIDTGAPDGEFDDPAGENLYRFEHEGKYGLRDAAGTVVLPAIYDDIYDMDDEAEVGDLVLGERVGLYGARGELVVPPILDELHAWREGFALAQVGEKFGYLGKGGRWLVEPRYDAARDFSNGFARVGIGGLAGYIDTTGREAIALRFVDGSSDFNASGVASVATRHGHGLIDSRGHMLVQAGYRAAEYLDGLEAWKLTHPSGRVDLFLPDASPWFSGRFDEVAHLEDKGDALVRIGESYGTYRRDGQPGIPVACRDVSLLCRQESSASAAGWAIYLVSPAGEGCDGVMGACLDDGTTLVPPRFAGIDVLQELLVPPGCYDTAVPDLFVVDMPDGSGAGLWSASRQHLLVPGAHAAIWGMVAGGHALLLAYHPERQWLILHRDGRPLFPHGYEGFSRHRRELDQMAALMVAGDIDRAWREGKAVHARRNGQGWRLFADGTEVTEEAYLLAQVRSPIATPIAATAQEAARFGPHVIAGVGDSAACAALGDVYALGDGVAIDLHQACRWYATAAAGDWPAKYVYACWLAEGKGCDADPHAARRQLEELVATCPDYRDAFNLLGRLVERELAGECDPARARALYTSAAGTDKYASADAQYNLGRCWRDGIGGPVDRRKALKWLELATIVVPECGRGGHPQACAAAADLHRDLARQAKNDKERQKHLQRAGYFATALAKVSPPP